MATATQRAAAVGKACSGGPPWSMQFYEAASQTFKKGALVTLDGSGNLIECSTPSPDRILGMALADATNTTASTNLIGVAIADDQTQFSFNLVAGEATSRALIGGRYGLVKSASAPLNWQIETNYSTIAVTSHRVIVTELELAYGEKVGDTGARVLARIASARTIMMDTSPAT